MRVSRNQPCPCGSGLKYKRCHADRPDELPEAVAASRAKTGGAADATPSKPKPKLKYRQCGGCQICCGPPLHINTPELIKTTGETCPHLGEWGCTLWGDEAMPQVCRSYMCNYLVEPTRLTVDERPDRVGAIFEHRGADGTRLIECAPGGLTRIMNNPFWGPLIRRHLLTGVCLKAAFLDDHYRAESIHVKWADNRLGCALPSCDDNGKPILVVLSPVYERETHGAWFIKDQGFPFEARVLVEYLGDRDAALLTPSRALQSAGSVRFRITRRQTEFLKALLAIVASATSRS